MALLNQPTVIFTKYTIILKSIDAVLLLDSGWGCAEVLPTCHRYTGLKNYGVFVIKGVGRQKKMMRAIRGVKK